MPLISGVLRWYTVAEELRAAAYAAMAGSSVGAPDRSCVVPGAIAWDECDCGLLAVSVARTYYSDDFPAEQTAKVGAGSCRPAWDVAEIRIQAIRCAPSPQGEDLSPTCAALNTSAQEVAIDASTVKSAVSLKLCQMEESNEVIDYLIQGQTVEGPQGGCVGSELRVLVALPAA